MGKFCFNCGKQLKSGTVFCSNCGTKLVRSSTAPSNNIADRLAPAAGVLAGAAVVAAEGSAQAQTTNVANAAVAAPPNELTGEAVKNAIDIGANVIADATDNASDAADAAGDAVSTLFDIFFG